MSNLPPVPDDGWPARLDELLAGARRRRAERQRIREQFAAARAAGLKARHQAKLARADPGTVPPSDRGNQGAKPID